MKSLKNGHLNILSHSDQQNANNVLADQSAFCGEYYERHVREPHEKLQKNEKERKHYPYEIVSFRSDFILDFPSPASESKYARGKLKNLPLTELTVCFWINSPKPEDRRTVFSYFGNSEKTELALEISDLHKTIFTVGGEER